ncbi:uncharacterized protein LOC121284814 isoform X2 [Carcharodon carcharias]|uniref:uncharacterized protein LOC121284814 isoform X2 n=1 Tax=Carcharodon carcharias TaxID=13397 RepID=UPI001B7EA29B|nr:uncharacterized protein LOC121284814 isoform X2 [Carcharodon carcharias]
MEGSGSDPDSPPARRARLCDNSYSNFEMNLRSGTISLRISDRFAQTVGGIICPIVIAGASVCLLKQLHSMNGVLSEVAEAFGLFLRATRPGSIIVEFGVRDPPSEDTFKQFLQKLKTELQKLLPSANFWIDRIEDPANARAPLEPLVSEVDFARHILKFVCSELEAEVKALSSGTVDWLDIRNTIGDLKCLIKKFEEKRTKISMLSQNGKGKSSILNFLLCLTADSEVEYKQNNMYLKDLSKTNTRQEMAKIPQVIREELEKLKEDERKEVFQRMFAKCKRTSTFPHSKMAEALKNEKRSFDSLSNYFESSGSNFLQPYLLPVKDITNIHSTTTKCNVRLKYGTVYQMKIKYFNIEELQSILYELVTMVKEGSDVGFSTEKDRRDTSRKALAELFCLLTTYFPDGSFDQNVLQNIESPGSIQLRQDVKDLAGTSECYVGDGEDVKQDRIFIRENLQKYVTTQQIPSEEITLRRRKITALKTIEVYAPCKILIGKELLEAPGIDESDSLALKEINDVLNEVNLILYISDFCFKTSESEVKEFLLQSGFLQKCVANLENQKLFLIAYPEKSSSLRLSPEMAGKESSIFEQQSEKRKQDLIALERLFQKELADEFKRNLSTPTLYPVSYASILMKAGDPTEVVRENETLLKLTGMQSFLEEIDHFAFNCAKSSVEEAKDLLCLLEDTAKQHLQYCEKGEVEKWQKLLQNKESMGLLLSSANERHENVLMKTFKKLKEARKDLILNTVKPFLKDTAEEAVERWNSNKSQINRMGIFNPYYNGRHPAYKLKIYDIVFGYLKMPDFTKFLDETRNIMEEYKECAIFDLSEFLAIHFEKDTDKMQRLVRRIAEKELDAAIGWYMGKKRLPFTEIKLHKLFKEALVHLLKELLKRVYSMKNIEEAKEKVSKDLKMTLSKADVCFESKLEFELHEKRWKSFIGKMKTRGTNPKSRIWQLVTTSLKNEFKMNEIEKFKSNVSNMIQMVDAALKGTRTTS